LDSLCLRVSVVFLPLPLTLLSRPAGSKPSDFDSSARSACGCSPERPPYGTHFNGQPIFVLNNYLETGCGAGAAES
jgi:hypothetical protein